MFRNMASTSSRTFRTIQTRQFSLSTARRAGSDGSVKTDKHAVNKAQAGDTHNVQEANASAGMQKKSSGTGGNAADQKDNAGGKTKAKKEFPEAPDVAIGMQDERGGKGG